MEFVYVYRTHNCVNKARFLFDIGVYSVYTRGLLTGVYYGRKNRLNRPNLR